MNMRKKLNINKRSTVVNSQSSLPNETNSASLIAMHKQSNNSDSKDINLNVDLGRHSKKGIITKIFRQKISHLDLIII